MVKRKSTPQLNVFFDTNALYTQAASDLVRSEIQQLCIENSKHVDLKIIWYLPEVVVNERRFQMLKRAKDLLPNLQKMERLLGHAFGVGDDTLQLHVDKVINSSIEQLGMKIANLDTKKVNWQDIINRSANRLPPFELGEKEKGFRDAMIANTFAQVCQNSPSTPSICRLAIVTGDQLLKEYIDELTSGAKNVRILDSIDELGSLINTLVSNVPEDFASELAEMASKLFFVKGDEKCLYYKEDVYAHIKRDFDYVLDDRIVEGSLRKNGTWWITSPIFVKKVRQRIHWVSMVEPEFKIYHYGSNQDETDLASEFSRLANPSTSSNRATSEKSADLRSTALTRLLGDPEVVDRKGRERFEVSWSASLTQAKHLTKASIDSVKYLGNHLDEDS